MRRDLQIVYRRSGPICPDSGAVIQISDAGIGLRCARLAHNQEPTGLDSRPRYQSSPDQTTMPRAATRTRTQHDIAGIVTLIAVGIFVAAAWLISH